MPTIYADDINYFTTRIRICAKLLDGYVEVSYDVDPDESVIYVNNEHDFINNHVKCGFIKTSTFLNLRKKLGLRCDNMVTE